MNVLFHIILFILKILGILLPVILGVVLLVLLTVLFVPIRYRGEGSWYKRPGGMVKLTWLLHLVSVRAAYEKELEITVRLLGIPLLRMHGQEEGNEGKKGAGAGRQKGFQRQEEEPKDGLEALLDEEEEELLLSAQELGDGAEDAKSEAGGPFGDSGDNLKNVAKKKKGIFKRIKERLCSVWNHLKASFQKLTEKIKDLDRKKDELLAFLADEKNRKTFNIMKRQVLRILKHLKPTRLKGHITFGLEDPYAMGQALSVAGFFYPLYGRQLVLTPVFDGKKIEGEIKIQGRIRAGVFAAAALRILLNRNFRKLLKKFLS